MLLGGPPYPNLGSGYHSKDSGKAQKKRKVLRAKKKEIEKENGNGDIKPSFGEH